MYFYHCCLGRNLCYEKKTLLQHLHKLTLGEKNSLMRDQIVP